MDYMSYPFLLRHFFARYVRALLFRNFKFSPHTSTLIKMLESLNLLSIIYLCKLLIRITIVLIVVNHTSLLRMLKNTVIQLTKKNFFSQTTHYKLYYSKLFNIPAITHCRC